MLLIQGEIWDNERTEEALKLVRGQIPKTLSRGPLNPEIVIEAADRLAAQMLSDQPDSKLAALCQAADVPSDTLFDIAKRFRRGPLSLRLKLELEGMPEHTPDGARLMTVPLGTLLHLAAGNLDVIPAYSVLEGLLTGNINLLKLPSADQGLSLALLERLIQLAPELRDYIYVFDTPSSDLAAIQELMRLAYGIVIWGSDETTRAVRSQAPVNCRLIEWGHKLSFAWLASSALNDEPLRALARHILDTRQLLCSSCQGIFLNTENFEEVKNFGRRFSELMGQLEASNRGPLALRGKIAVEREVRRLELLGTPAKMFENRNGSVLCLPDSELEMSMLLGNLWVKPLPAHRLLEQLWPHRTHLQTVGVNAALSPELAAIFAACGLTDIRRIDQMSDFSLFAPHDGFLSLRCYVRIVQLRV